MRKLRVRSISKAHRQSANNIARNGAEGTKDIVLTQANIFNDIGKRLRVGIGRRGKQEGTSLDAIIYFVRETSEDMQVA